MSEPRQSTSKLGYRPELDGVRALAVLAILLYHLTFLVPWYLRSPVKPLAGQMLVVANP